MMSLRYATVVPALLEAVPALATWPEYQELVADFEGSAPPHLSFGALTRLIVELERRLQQHPSADQQAGSALYEALRFLEQVASSADPDVQDLSQVSFVENLDPRDPTYANIKMRAGPALRAQFEAVERDDPS